MKIAYLDAPYAGKVELCPETISYLKKQQIKNLGLFASVQFIHNLDTVKRQLQDLEIHITTSKAARTDVKGQLLGCDVDDNSLQVEAEVCLYIGDGKFHPLALLHAGKTVICNDPVAKHMEVLDPKIIQHIERRRKGALSKFYSSDHIGVIISIKPGQQQYQKALQLEEKYPQKQFYFFVDDNVSFGQLENFPFIQVWVNTACPRIGLDDVEKFPKGVVNLKDVL